MADGVDIEALCQDMAPFSSALGEGVKRLTRAAKAWRGAMESGAIEPLPKLAEDTRAAIAALETLVQTEAPPPIALEAVINAMNDPAYTEALQRAFAQAGVALTPIDNSLIAYPTTLRLTGRSAAVTLNGKRTTTLRPAALANLVREMNKKRKLRKADKIIEHLYKVARHLAPRGAGAERSRAIEVRVVDLFELMTLAPEASYSRLDFALDLYTLDASGVRTTRDGTTLTFMGSTGTKGSDALRMVGPDGRVVAYFGLRFEPAGTGAV